MLVPMPIELTYIIFQGETPDLRAYKSHINVSVESEGIQDNLPDFAFKIEGDNITFTVTGYGHGVGMSQTGADSLAKSGSNYEAIVKHFYTNVEIIEVNSL